MGAAISAVRSSLKEADEIDKKDMEQRLKILESLVNGKLDKEMSSILQGKRGDQEIHSGTIVEMFRKVNIVAEEHESENITGAAESFFSGDVKGGLSKIIEFGENAVLGNASIGEYEMNHMFIVWTSNALLRCDVYFYRWNFVSKGVIPGAEGCVGVLLVKRVIDSSKIDPQVLTWAISEQARSQGHDDKTIPGIVYSALKVFEKVVQLQRKVKKIEASEEKEETMQD